MSVGKYSPTVSAAYGKDQKWWEKNGGATNLFDAEGYDSYGYNVQDLDRAGYTENDYLNDGTWVTVGDTEEYVYQLFDQVYFEWTVGENGRPQRKA
jgi:hypothetical protein